jgi:hypothetical protein
MAASGAEEPSLRRDKEEGSGTLSATGTSLQMGVMPQEGEELQPRGERELLCGNHTLF